MPAIYMLSIYLLGLLGGHVFDSVGVFVCLSVSKHHMRYSKGCEQIALTLYGGVWGGNRKN